MVNTKILSTLDENALKKKKNQIGIHIVLKNYKYLKSLFLNILSVCLAPN